MEVFIEPDSYRLQLVECQFFAEEALCPLPQEHGLNAIGGDAELLAAAVQFIDQHIPEERGRILTNPV